MLSRIRRLLSPKTDAKLTWAQRGEDVIVDNVLQQLGIFKPTYLDIGAHHPTELSNTALFYQRGCSGVCVEPDPVLYDVIRKARERDVCLNVGIGGTEKSSAAFYVMSVTHLSTFSKETAELLASSEGMKIQSVIDVPLVPVNEILEKYFPTHPNFLSLDTEEYDLRILESMNFDRFRPEVICVETLTYSSDRTKQSKITEIPDFLKSVNYELIADTHINGIFVDSVAWNSMMGR